MVSRARNDRFAKRYSLPGPLVGIRFSKVVVLRSKVTTFVWQSALVQIWFDPFSLQPGLPVLKGSLQAGPPVDAVNWASHKGLALEAGLWAPRRDAIF